jgi:hypothetical protein
MTNEFNNGWPIQRANFEEIDHRPLQFSDIFLRLLKKSNTEISETGHEILKLLAGRDKRFRFISDHIWSEGKISYLHLEEPYLEESDPEEPCEELGIQFKPFFQIYNTEYSFNPNLDYPMGFNAIRENIAFETTLLFVALKVATAGKEYQVSGWGRYHQGGTGDPYTGEDKRLAIKIWVSENSDRVIFTFISDGGKFAKIDAGEGSEEELYNPKYDQLVNEYWKEYFQTHPDHI